MDVDDAGGSTQGGSFAPASDWGHERAAREPGVSDQCGQRGPCGGFVAVVVVVAVVLLVIAVLYCGSRQRDVGGVAVVTVVAWNDSAVA